MRSTATVRTSCTSRRRRRGPGQRRHGDDQLFGDAGRTAFSWSPGDANDAFEGCRDGDDRFVINGGNVNEKFEVSPNGPRIRMAPTSQTVIPGPRRAETIELRRMNGGTDYLRGDNGLAELIPSIIVDGGTGNDTLTGGSADDAQRRRDVRHRDGRRRRRTRSRSGRGRGHRAVDGGPAAAR